MKFLLPHRYKKIGLVLVPLGFSLWVAMQLGHLTTFLTSLFGEAEAEAAYSSYHIPNVVVAIVSFFSFLGGIYMVAFSQEKIEDEMVQRTRLDSFQFAAVTQIIITIAGFLFMLLVAEPGKEGLMLFFVTLLVLFWLSFIVRFNYILHVKLKDEQ